MATTLPSLKMSQSKCNQITTGRNNLSVYMNHITLIVIVILGLVPGSNTHPGVDLGFLRGGLNTVVDL